jgi:CRISPR-associated protein Cst1
MLTYTGHPFVDVGVATITAFAGKRDPASVTSADLEAMANYIEHNYTRNPLRSFLTVAFTSNAWFAQPGFNPDATGLTDAVREERRRTRARWAEHHLRSWSVQPDSGGGPFCVFTGLPVTARALSGKLQPGRAGRAQVPLLQGDDNINFYPGGDSGIPVSGTALLCLQAFPLGCAKVAGSLLVIHADDNHLTYRFARRNLDRNLREVSLAQQSGADKLPEERHSLGTLLVGTLLDIQSERIADLEEEEAASSVTAYHLNNGQAPKLDIYHVPLEVTWFLRKATAATYRARWDALVSRGWQRPPTKNAKGNREAGVFEPRRNYLYEDVLTLPDQAPRFLRLYFLRSALRRAFEDDPRRQYSPLGEADLVSWELTQLFLTEVLHVDSIRINEIRDLGDRLAAYVRNENDRRFFRTFLTEQRYPMLRLALIRADVDSVRRGQHPIITFEQFIEVFEDAEDLPRADWRLSRDLVLIRMIEQLHANGWLTRNAAELGDAVSEVDGENGALSAASNSREEGE